MGASTIAKQGAKKGKGMLKNIIDSMDEKGLADLMDLSQVPDVPQVPMERYNPKKMGKGVEEHLTPENAQRLEEVALRGEAAGGREWYNLDPLRQAFMERHGKKKGVEYFERYIDILAATSPRSTVSSNIRRSSHLNTEAMNGRTFSTLENSDLPKGYGHIAHKTHNALLTDIENSGGFDALNRPKTSSFAENLKGNQEPMTIDTHNFSAVRNDPGNKKSPSQTQYKYLENYQAEIAKKLDMTPAQFQASVWMGADTGVADARPFLEVFDDVVTRTAEKNGTSRSKALADFIDGKAPLYGLAGLIGSGALITPGEAEAGTLTAGARGARDLIDYAAGKKGVLKPKGKNESQAFAQMANQIKKRARTHSGPAIAEGPIHQLTNYDDWSQGARRKDGTNAGPAYKHGLDAFLEEAVERHPDIEQHIQPYAQDRLIKRQEGHSPKGPRSNQQGSAQPGLMSMLFAGGAGATAAGNESNAFSRGAGQVWDDLKGTAGGLLDVAEIPARGLQGLGRVGYGLATGEGFDESMRQGNDVLQGGTEAAAKRAGDEVFKRTGSAEMATAAYTAVMTGSPI
jgi:hypothetical protein